jgi:hypothetical protein
MVLGITILAVLTIVAIIEIGRTNYRHIQREN